MSLERSMKVPHINREVWVIMVSLIDCDLHSSENLKLTAPIPVTLHLASVYLSGLSEGSRRTIRYSLNTIAELLTNGDCDADTLDWSKRRYQHTAAVRVALLQKLAPVTANKMLSALRRALLEAYRLGLMAADDYHKAVDFPNIQAEPELRGVRLIQRKLQPCWGLVERRVRWILGMLPLW